VEKDLFFSQKWTGALTSSLSPCNGQASRTGMRSTLKRWKLGKATRWNRE
jgi:hypothetical protein